MIRIKIGLPFLCCIALTNLSLGQATKTKSAFNKPLADKLDSVLIDAQNDREKFGKMLDNGIKDTAAFVALAMKVRYQDTINQAKVEDILAKYGWLGPNVVGEEGDSVLFMAIQKARLEKQEKYLPMLQDAVKHGEAKARNLAMLEDIVNLREGKKQVYGTQLDENKQPGVIGVSPLEDPDNVDKRRAEMGLPTMAEYCRNSNISWDLERYKKGLPLLSMSTISKN